MGSLQIYYPMVPGFCIIILHSFILSDTVSKPFQALSDIFVEALFQRHAFQSTDHRASANDHSLKMFCCKHSPFLPSKISFISYLMGNCTHKFPVLNNRAAAHECLSLGTTIFRGKTAIHFKCMAVCRLLSYLFLIRFSFFSLTLSRIPNK